LVVKGQPAAVTRASPLKAITTHRKKRGFSDGVLANTIENIAHNRFLVLTEHYPWPIIALQGNSE
jgi:hypothetical protein